jgi:hypothetical protein
VDVSAGRMGVYIRYQKCGLNGIYQRAVHERRYTQVVEVHRSGLVFSLIGMALVWAREQRRRTKMAHWTLGETRKQGM